jgi:hypothetical protein
MQTKCTTKIEINKVGVEFTAKKITAYGGFSLLASFFNQIRLKDFLEEVIPVKERSPNTVGIYSKLLAYILMIYAGGNRFSHLLYLGGDGKKLILRISVFTQKLQSKLTYLYNRIQQYSPNGYANCNAFG